MPASAAAQSISVNVAVDLDGELLDAYMAIDTSGDVQDYVDQPLVLLSQTRPGGEQLPSIHAIVLGTQAVFLALEDCEDMPPELPTTREGLEALGFRVLETTSWVVPVGTAELFKQEARSKYAAALSAAGSPEHAPTSTIIFKFRRTSGRSSEGPRFSRASFEGLAGRGHLLPPDAVPLCDFTTAEYLIMCSGDTEQARAILRQGALGPSSEDEEEEDREMEGGVSARGMCRRPHSTGTGLSASAEKLAGPPAAVAGWGRQRHASGPGALLDRADSASGPRPML
ncbi:hypothetical protein WJX72_012087 [[Myrmecia] bisecta]|uniref:Uncharacterized protein n=1 Tax=[Myrmecia] bisecta TaxID=41462 RepID=A0AAW1PIM4_9CHLO